MHGYLTLVQGSQHFERDLNEVDWNGSAPPGLDCVSERCSSVVLPRVGNYLKLKMWLAVVKVDTSYCQE